MNTLRFHFALLVIGLFSIFNAPTLKAQSARDGDFAPNPNGAINVIVEQPDGKIIIGGGFTELSPNGGAPITRYCIVRYNPDGTLDTAFNPGYIYYAIHSIIVLPDGKILVAGGFTSIGGHPRRNIARLDAVTGQPDSFNPGADNAILQIALQSDGKILAIGHFRNIGGQAREYIARLDPATGLADSFNPDVNYYIYAIAVQADGKILVGGNFTHIGGQPRNRIARLDKDTGLADSFDPNASSNSYPYSQIVTIAVQADGKILVGGAFTHIGGQSRRYLARLDKDTGAADSFDPNPPDMVRQIVVQPDGKILMCTHFSYAGEGVYRSRFIRYDKDTGQPDSLIISASTPFYPSVSQLDAIAVQADGRILLGGNFTTVAPNGDAAEGRKNLVRFERDGKFERTLYYEPLSNLAETAFAIQPDGKILIGYNFTDYYGAAYARIVRLHSNGSFDASFNYDSFGGKVYAIAVQPDGKILVGGSFTHIRGQPRTGIARLDKDTGLPDSFNPGANGNVYSIAVQPDGKILAGGAFTNIGGQARNRIARLDKDTWAADSLDPNADSAVNAIAIQTDGRILVSGDFTHIGGQPRSRLARLEATTGAADSFDPNPDNQVYAIAVQADGKILVGGNFTGIGGQPRNRIARLDAVTGAADSFNPNANNTVDAINIQSDGKILVGGDFNGTNSIGAQSRNYMARLSATTGAADSFNPNANGHVNAIAIQRDGKILAGGGFSSIGGHPRDRFARLTNDTAALSTLSVSRTSVILTRGGAAALFNQVLFEMSTDNGVNWTTLGTATNSLANKANENGENQFAPLAPEAAGYTLAGLNLPTGQNILVRARGFFSSGFRNGSKSIEDKVQIAFLPAPTAAQVSVSGRVFTLDGSGLRNASVMLTDGSGNSHTVITSSLGYFRFDAVQAGETYIFSVVAKGHQFTPQAVTVNEELSELSFTALE